MSKTRFNILLIATLLLVAAAVGERLLGTDYAVTLEENRPALPGLIDRVNDVVEFRLKGTDHTLTFSRDDDGWRLLERSGYPADGDKIQKTLFQLTELKLTDPKTRRADRYGRIGVADPESGEDGAGRLVSLATADGDIVASLIVGDKAEASPGTFGDARYIRRAGEDQSWLADGALSLGEDVKDWIDRRVLDIPPERVARATLTHPDGETVTVVRDDAGKLKLLGIPEGFKLISDFRRDVIVEFISELEIDDVRTEGETDADWSNATVAMYRLEDATSLRLDLAGDEDAGYWLRNRAEGGEGADAINAKVSGWVYAVPGWKAGDIKRGMADLIEPVEADETVGG